MKKMKSVLFCTLVSCVQYDPDVGVSGGAALLEGKSSSDGLTYILTDSQGSVSIYGFGSSAEYLKVCYVLSEMRLLHCLSENVMKDNVEIVQCFF